MAVNSDHHQAVRELGTDVRIVGRAPDGVVEAIELPSRRFARGVQWHLELMLGQDGGAEAILGRFVEACRRAPVPRRGPSPAGGGDEPAGALARVGRERRGPASPLDG